MQELGPEQAEAIASLLPHGRLEPRLDYEGIGIALRHPAEVAPLALPRREARIARLAPGTWPGLEAPLEVVNLHVLAPHQLPPWRTFAARDRARCAASRAGWTRTPIRRASCAAT